MNQLANVLSIKNIPSKQPRLPGQDLPYSLHIFLYRQGVHEPEYLLFHHIGCPDLGLTGFWQGIDGNVLAGESWEQAAQREIFGQSRLIVPNLCRSNLMRHYPVKQRSAGAGLKISYVSDRVYYAKLAPNALPELSSQHNALGWFTYEKAQRLLCTGTNRHFLESVTDNVFSLGETAQNS